MPAFAKALLAVVAAGCLLPAQAAAPKRTKTRPAAHSRTHAKVRLLDINTASATQLARVPGLDKALAAAIIAHRPYLTKEHLVLKHAIPEPVYFAIRDRITCIPPGVRKARAERPTRK